MNPVLHINTNNGAIKLSNFNFIGKYLNVLIIFSLMILGRFQNARLNGHS